MANFSYVAYDRQGKERKGTVEAEDRERALTAVKLKDLTPVSVTEQNFLNQDINISMSKGASVRDLSLFCRQFASILRAGVTIIDALGMMAEQTENKGFSGAIKNVQINIQKGESLGNSMRKYPEYFPNMMVSLIDAGEQSGTVDVSLDRAALQFEKDAKLKGLIKKAMVYPTIVIVVAIGVIIVLLTWVVPTFMNMFKDMDIEMPAITLFVVALSNFVKGHIILILIALIAFVIGLTVFRKSGQGQAFFGLVGVRIPMLANFTVKSQAARFSRTLGTLTSSGIQMVDALEITARTMTNVLFRDSILNAREEVMKGVPLSEPLKKDGLFPPMVIHMISIGEETGDLESMLDKLADYYDEEVELATQSLLAALEPMITLVLGGIVVFILAAVFSPMLALYNGLDNL